MPTLEWIGKDKVVNHHLDVPYRVLEHHYTYMGKGENGAEIPDGNKIIRGDNLEALKALLPQYEGRIKCIYIDPPYNTGNEGWVYNDNVNDPKIKKWLGEVVGKEGEDLSRHDKWLCMMYPRLRLLQRLLADDGAIFISIDDNELYNLKMLCDEVFGNNNFLANISWQRTYSTRNDSKGIVTEIEHLIVYSKQQYWKPRSLPRTEKMDSIYKNLDNDINSWTSSDPFAKGGATHQGMVYAIQHPFTGKMIYPSNSAHWRYQQNDMLEIMRGWCNYELKDLHDEHERALVCSMAANEVRKDVKGIVLSDPLEIASEQAKKVYDRGQWPRFYFTKGGRGGIRRKTYLENVGGRLPTNLWPYAEVGHTDEAKKQLLGIFSGRTAFDTPKPTRLIERILQIATGPDSIILDSFAGSGTTAHAVLNMNKRDGGNRKFILVEMMDYAENITAERVRRVIDGYADVPGTGGSFSFYDLGDPLLLENKYINEAVSVEKIREYVWFMETGQSLPQADESEPYLLGRHNRTAYYFCYKKDHLSTLDHIFLQSITTKADAYIIYADINILSDAELERHHLIFKKIPRDMAKL